MKRTVVSSFVVLAAASLLASCAHAQAVKDEHPFRGRDAKAALLSSPPPSCMESIGKALLKMRRYLAPQDIRPDLFTQTAYETIRITQPDGRPAVYHFTLRIDHYDKICRISDSQAGSSQVPGCDCVFENPQRAADPYGYHLSQLVRAGRVKAIQEACTASAHPVDAQARAWREAALRYAAFKVRVPDLLKSVKQQPGWNEQREAIDYALAKADLEKGVVYEQAYVDQRKNLDGVADADRDTACKGANNMMTEWVMNIGMEMKMFEVFNKVKID